MNPETLEQLITLYLDLNTEPSDEQVHNLAYSLGISKESLEEVMYKMMADHQSSVTSDILIELPVKKKIAPTSEFTDVLEDNYDPDLTTLTDLASNDGDVGNEDIGSQEELLNDGIGPEDEGLGINVSNLTTNDGCVIMGSVLTESILGSLDPVKDSLMHSLVVLQKARPVITRYSKELEKQSIITIAAIKNAVVEVKILMEEVDS